MYNCDMCTRYLNELEKAYLDNKPTQRAGQQQNKGRRKSHEMHAGIQESALIDSNCNLAQNRHPLT